MKTWTVFFDNHKWAPHDLKIKEEFGPQVFYGGDNHEMKNIPCKDVKKRVHEYKLFLKKCEETDTKVVSGNHERRAGTKFCGNEYYVNDGVVFLHGDFLAYSEKNYTKWRMGDLGRGKLKLLLVKIYDKIFRYESSRLSKKYRRKAVELMDTLNCHTLVFGHRHPRRIIDVMEITNDKAYRIINCPRGKSLIEV